MRNKKKRPARLGQKKQRSWPFLTLAFLIPFLGFVTVLILAECMPFGEEKAFLYSDEYHQYYPFFVNFREALLKGDSLTYNWQIGMGLDYLGLVSYYLGSPLNLLSVLVPESLLLEYFSILPAIRLGFAGLFFAIMLKKLYGKNDVSIAMFGAMYALCAWALAYQWNVMWLDTFALLPLVIAGTISLLRDKKVILYTVTLFFSIVCNYYVGLFTCVFVMLVAICYELCRCSDAKRMIMIVLCGVALFFCLVCSYYIGLLFCALIMLISLCCELIFYQGYKWIIKISAYAAALALSFFLKDQLGLIPCIAVMLASIGFELYCSGDYKWLLPDLGRIALFSALAIGMTAFLELPALTALGNTQSSNNSFPEYFTMNIVKYDDESRIAASDAWKAYRLSVAEGAGFFTIVKNWFFALGESFPPVFQGMKQIAGNMGGGIKHSFKEGLPNIYSGVSVLVMAFLFLTTSKVKLRDKICSITLLLFFMVSFLLHQLDYIWHGFHFPNMIPYRFSFLFSFVVIWMAYRAWLLRDQFKLWQLAIAGVLTVGLLALHEDFSSMTFLFFNGIMLLLTLGLFTFIILRRMRLNKLEQDMKPNKIRRLENRHHVVVSAALSLVMIAEVVLNLFSFAHFFTTTTITNYPKGTTDTADAISYMKYKERNTPFYRAEMTHTQTYNDSALNNYNGITTFTSSANVKATYFMQSLGYGAKDSYNRYAFEESSPVANLFLNLKYMIERDGDVEENSYFDTVHHFGNVYLQENNRYLPLGFLAESELAEWKFIGVRSAFDRQNQLFSAATGIEEDVWDMAYCQQITSNDVTLNVTIPSEGRVNYKASSKGTITYCYFAHKTGFMCIDVNAPKRNNVRLYRQSQGRRTELYSESLSLRQMMAVSEVKAGEYVFLEIDCKADEAATISVEAGIVNKEVFDRGYDILSASTMKITDFSNTRVEGTIDCNRDGLLYTSIPANGNWYAEVDGKEAQLVLVGDCMAAVQLTEGRHNVVFRYDNQSFTTGLLISAVSLVVFVGLILLNRLLLMDLAKKIAAESAVRKAEALPDALPPQEQTLPGEGSGEEAQEAVEETGFEPEVTDVPAAEGDTPEEE